MRREHRPYFLKKAFLKFQDFYVKYRIKPQFDYFGKNISVIYPWQIVLFGSPIRLGDYANVFATSDNKVRFTIWPEKKGQGKIEIGNYALISPGVRINSAVEVTIGDSCMFGAKVSISDADWHDLYNRVAFGKVAPVRIENNVWVGESVIICKGVTIGQNSVIGAGSVVVSSIPPNCVAAGNPAKVVKDLDPNIPFVTRADWFSNPEMLNHDIDDMDRTMLKDNNIFHWLRTIVLPSPED